MLECRAWAIYWLPALIRRQPRFSCIVESLKLRFKQGWLYSTRLNSTPRSCATFSNSAALWPTLIAQ